MIEKILVPLDGSELADGILPYVSHLAKGLNAEITLVSIVNPDSVKSQGNSDEQRSQAFERVETRVSDMLQKKVDALESVGISASRRVAFGEAADEIVNIAESEGFDLIAMSSHARNVLIRGILGSVTDKIIHTSSVPVLTVRPDEAEKYQAPDASLGAVMVPLDGSELSERALSYGEEIAQSLSLKMILARAVSPIAFASPVDEYGAVDASGVGEQIEKQVDDYLNKIADGLRANGIEVECRVLAGSPAYAIVDLAHEAAQGLVVMSTRGRSGFKRWLLGSVTERVVRSSGDPVLIIPPPDEE